MKSEVEPEFMSDVRSSDDVVVDISGYTGTFIAKADGVKVYVFCCEFGYVVTITDPSLTIISSMVIVTHRVLPETTRTPDVLLAEMMVDGTIVYIDTLAMDRSGGCLRVCPGLHAPSRPDGRT